MDSKEMIEAFEKLSKDAERVQRETLKKILEENGKCEYLEKWGLNGRTDPESFKACVPIVTHQDIQPYIQRIMDGDSSPLLTEKPITAISLRELPVVTGMDFRLWYGCKQFKTTGGLPVATVSSHMLPRIQSQVEVIKPCSPAEVVTSSTDYQQSLYCHLLSGLVFHDQVETVSSTFALTIVNAFRTFEHVWKDLCTDIRRGSLSSSSSIITVPSSFQTAMMSQVLIKPNPELADLIYDKCMVLEAKGWSGVIPELFPNTKYIVGIMTGSMIPYTKKLRHYAGQKIPLVSRVYVASEGCIGVNLNPRAPPDEVVYTVLPNIGHYYEFIPTRKKNNNNADADQNDGEQAVGLAQVRIGEEYEILITNPAGLYRYRLGDIVKVTGFYNSTPQLQFICRSNLLLSIHLDKNTEKDLQLAVEQASKLLSKVKIELVDYTSRVESSTDPGHYVIFWEVNSAAEGTDQLFQECCNSLDTSFVDEGYASSRRINAIGALELKIVQIGTFKEIMQHSVKQGTSPAQFKTPRLVGSTNAAALLQILSRNVVKRYSSTAYTSN